jgi:aminoglycoside/choline kinase family phosphotransferase
MAREARVMEYVRAEGYPAPRVEEVSQDGLAMVIQRIDGVDMVEAMRKRPWTIPRLGGVLAGLHERLHELAAPDWLHDAPVGQGDRLLHLDLHPLNVMMSRDGPVVIDWTAACRGDPLIDVALVWALMEAGSPPAGRLTAALLGRARAPLVKSFLRPFDMVSVKRVLGEVVAWKVQDPHMSAREQAGMWQLVEAVGA